MQKSDFAIAILVDTFGRFLLQQRDDIPGIVNPGKVGFFGGHREQDETHLQCVVREISEEISYCLQPGDFEHLGSCDLVDDKDGRRSHGEIYIAREIPADQLEITEGSLLIATLDDFSAMDARLSPSARVAINAYLRRYDRR